MNSLQDQIKTKIDHHCLIYIGNDRIKISYFSEEKRDEIEDIRERSNPTMFREALNLFLYIRELNPLYLGTYTVENFYHGLHGLLKEKFAIIERHVIKYTFVVQGSNQCKELVRTALEEGSFFALAGTDRIALLTDAEAAAFSVAINKTQQIKVVSLYNGIVTNLTASKQEVKVESEEKKVEFDFMAQLAKVTPGEFCVKQFKNILQGFGASDINDLDITLYPENVTVSLKPIQEFFLNAFKNIKKEPNDTKLVILNNFGLFDKVVKKLICNISKTNATQATDASKKVELARNEQRRLQVRIHEMEDSFNILQIKRDKLKLGADKNKVVQKAFEAADEELKLAQENVKPVREELEAAKKDCVKAEDEEYNTWVEHVSEIDANGLINGANVSTKPLIIVTPIYDDIKKTGLYETTAVNYPKIVAIDFGTDESKIVVYEKIEDEWIKKKDYVEPSLVYLNNFNELKFGNEALNLFEKDLQSCKVGKLFKSFKLVLEEVEIEKVVESFQNTTIKYLGHLLEMVGVMPNAADCCFCITRPTVFGLRAKERMDEVVIKSGMKNVTFLTESEAVALYAARNLDLLTSLVIRDMQNATAGTSDLTQKDKIEELYKRLLKSLETNAEGKAKHLLICDMGGGTSDMAMYRIVKEDGKDRITQITPNDGEKIGSHMLDQAFSDFVQKKYHLHNLGLHDNVETFLQPLVSKFATKTKIDFDGKTEINFKGELDTPGAKVDIEITYEELRDNIFEPIFRKIIGTISRIIKHSRITPDIIYFSGGLSLAQALRKQAKDEEFSSKLVFGDDNSTWDVATGAAIFAMDPSIVDRRIALKSYFIESYVKYNNVCHPNRRIIQIAGKEYVDGGLIQLCNTVDRIEANRFFEYQFSLFPLQGGDGAISLPLHHLLVNDYKNHMPNITGDCQTETTATYYIPVKNMVAFEKEPLTIRIFPCSLNLPIEAIFRGITYHLQAFGVVEAHSSTKKLNYDPLQIEGEVKEEIEVKDKAEEKINKKANFLNRVKDFF